ncbi:MAG: hypothetical protein JXR25_10060 [Pontiellaceae bacterium]|nr:hypothetical protein [Pontiellaceae bacterium]MBN2785162.1 hypothetical protein [Pontiellaceae bacterium]
MLHFLFGTFLLIFADGCRSMPPAAPVVMSDLGESVEIDNSEITLLLDKESGRITSMKRGGRELLAQKGIYMQFYGKGADGENVAAPELKIVHESSEMVDVAHCAYRKGFETEMHYVVRAGEPGFYNYIVIRNDPSSPAEEHYLEQVNLLIRANPELFRYAKIGPEKEGLLPTPQQMKAGDQIMDATYLLKDGTVDAKYDWCLEETGSRVFGLMGDDIGMFIVKDSGEALNSGPVARELTVHATTSTPVLMRHFTGAHYGRGRIVMDAADGEWAKLAGPWLVYVNEGTSREVLWADAKARSAAAQKAWPYTWLKNPLYPLERGSVKGRLNITDGTSPEGSLIFVGPAPTEQVPDWTQSGKGYFFWTRAAADGSFEIDKVREGDYSIWALNDDSFGEFRQDGISVKAGKTTQLGELAWTPAVAGRVLWQIGKPDRTSGEYRHGDDYRHWGLWLKYPDEFPNDVDFMIGTSDVRTDWNYVQPAVQHDDGSWSLPTWTIRFNVDEPLSGRATLRIGVAGVCAHAGEASGGEREAGFGVAINGEKMGSFRFAHDKGATRSGIRGNYHEVLIPFDAADLRRGENRITLTLESVPPNGIVKNFPYCSVMYDAIRLELE